MDILKKIDPAWPLRLGLGIMFLYSSYDIFMHPTAWYWAVRPLPQFLQTVINNQVGINTYLRMQALGEFTLALGLLLWFLPRSVVRWAAGLAALEMVGILFLVGVDAVTFRDISLLGAALSLWMAFLQKNTSKIKNTI